MCVLLDIKNRPTPYFTAEQVKFKNPVKPGDVVQTECEIMKSKSSFYFAEGKVTVDGKLCASGEFSFALI
jgi:3-hydroxyacyl-[acyl-carrier-protein] dehydratase